MIRLGFAGAGPMPVETTAPGGFKQLGFKMTLNGMKKELLDPFIRKQDRERQWIEKTMYEAFMRGAK